MRGVLHNHYPGKVQCGVPKVEIPLWAYSPHGPRAIFVKFLKKILKKAFFFHFLFLLFIFSLF